MAGRYAPMKKPALGGLVGWVASCAVEARESDACEQNVYTNGSASRRSAVFNGAAISAWILWRLPRL